MCSTVLKKLALYAALALSPAVLSAQGITGNSTSPVTNPDEATKSVGSQPDANQLQRDPDAIAYQRELEACDRQPSEQDACRAKVDAQHTNKGSTTAPGLSSR